MPDEPPQGAPEDDCPPPFELPEEADDPPEGCPPVDDPLPDATPPVAAVPPMLACPLLFEEEPPEAPVEAALPVDWLVLSVAEGLLLDCLLEVSA